MEVVDQDAGRDRSSRSGSKGPIQERRETAVSLDGWREACFISRDGTILESNKDDRTSAGGPVKFCERTTVESGYLGAVLATCLLG